MQANGKITLSTWYEAEAICTAATEKKEMGCREADDVVREKDSGLQCQWTMKPQSAVIIPGGGGDYKPIPTPRASKRCAVGAVKAKETRLVKG